MTEYQDRSEEAKEQAETAGFDVIVADDFMLTLDLDTCADVTQWDAQSQRLDQFGIAVSVIEEWKSKSGNRHILIRMKNSMPLRDRIGMEAILGSDRKRAALAMRGAIAGSQYACMLFKPKQEKEK